MVAPGDITPVMYLDPSGCIAIELTTGSIIAFCLGIVAIAYLTLQLCDALAIPGSGDLLEYLNNAVENASASAKKTLNSVKNKLILAVSIGITSVVLKKQYEYHHIVPQNASACQGAHDILYKVGISIDSPENIIILDYSTHRHIHTVAYYARVETDITSAYIEGDSQFANRVRVEAALLELRLEILMGLW